MSRLIAIGDIHGCLSAFQGLLEQIDPQPDDTIVLLGDYIDRGRDSKGVIDRVLQLQEECKVIALRGNHEEMMLDAMDGQASPLAWMVNGGDKTLDSYDSEAFEKVPKSHEIFLRSTQLYHEMDDFFFVHANYLQGVPLVRQTTDVLLWRRLDTDMPGPHISGKTAVVGHTYTLNEVFDAGHLVCLDTGCFAGGCLSAMEMRSRRVWQQPR